MAALITNNTILVVLTFLPPILWLLFYLREDRHPEPKRLLMLSFVGGAFSALLAVAAELALIGENYGIFSNFISIHTNVFIFFLVIALVEEYIKYLPVKFLILKRPDFDEPVDAMIYMMTSAMGFAAVENLLFAFIPFQGGFLAGLEIVTNRFLGANLLHALSSGLVGFFLARAWFHPQRHHFLAVGIALAALLHAAFNYLILIRGTVAQGTFYIIMLLAIMAVMVLMDFERLKRQRAAKALPNNN